MSDVNTKDAPISEIKAIGEKYGYDQVIILAKKPGLGQVVSWGKDDEHCDIAERAGNLLRWIFLG